MAGHAHFSPGRPSGIEELLGIVMGTLYCRSHLLCQRSSVKEHIIHIRQPESVFTEYIFSC